MTEPGTKTITFWWKVSSRANLDFLRFSIDGVLQARISGTVATGKALKNGGLLETPQSSL